MRERSSSFFRFIVWALICAFLLPTPVMTASANENPNNAHILRRLNSPERQAAIAEAARTEAAAREAYARSEAAASVAPAPRQETAQTPVPASRESAALAAADSPRPQSPQAPQSVTEVLFNYAAGFAGVPGLAPRQGIDGSLDEGLGFHQDGTARKAGGGFDNNGPSAKGYRAKAYMQSGLQGGYGLNGNGQGYRSAFNSGLYDEMYSGLWYRDSALYGGRVSASSGYSRELGDFDPLNMAIARGLNYGAGFLNSMGEAGISSLVDGGRARLNFMLDRDGYFSGEGDALLPFYDSQYSTAFVQLGGRSMHDESDTRWIGNLGVGQRWFPAASEDDSGNWMVGYNAFFDYDFTRDHQRGGIGVEAQYDWLRLASNYYFPLSSWRGSEDFDSDFVKERAAKGWDVRAKGYLPFYRNLAVTGAYSQWYGDHVGMFGASRLEKDPKVWSYGLEYTPVPLVSGFITQKSTERGRTDTEFGLNFTYHFQMPWEDQISHAKVAELRTVSGSRHEFVDRENRIILEYKAKDNYHIEFVSRSGNVFTFRIKHAFNEYAAGKTVRVSASGVTQLAEYKAAPQGFFAQAGEFLGSIFSVSTAHAADLFQSYTTDRNGEFRMTITGLVASSMVTIEAGEASRTFSGAELGGENVYTVDISGVTVNTGGAVSGTITVRNAGDNTPANGVSVTLLYKTSGGSGATVYSIALSGTTDAGGEISATGNVGGLQRKVVVAARAGTFESTYSSPFTIGTALPGNLITGDVNSGDTLDYTGAVGACTAQGGRLPTLSELQGMTGSWSGLPIGFYRTSDGPPGERDVVDMPSGLPNYGLDHLTSIRVVCHAP